VVLDAQEEGRADVIGETTVLVPRRRFTGNWSALFMVCSKPPILALILAVCGLVLLSGVPLWLKFLGGILAAASIPWAVVSVRHDFDEAFPSGHRPIRTNLAGGRLSR
jgi:membrane-associated phospholipid phosphatase